MSANIWEDIKMKYKQGNAIIKLIMVNVAVDLLVRLAGVFALLFNLENLFSFSDWFWFPSDLLKIPFRFWTIFTYMFLHNGFMHILFNMLVLYWFGKKLNDLLPQNKIFPIYILGGIAGALFFALGYNIFPGFYHNSGNLVGASASVMAIVLATATLNPKGTLNLFIIGRVQLQYVALFFVVTDLLVTIYSNPGGALAHLGGAFMGWLFIFQLRKGKDLSEPVNRVLDYFSREKKPRKVKGKKAKQRQTQGTFKSKMKIYKGSQKTDYYGNAYGRSFMQKYKEMSQEECLNTILGKIKLSGYDGLTEDEKIFLDRYQ